MAFDLRKGGQRPEEPEVRTAITPPPSGGRSRIIGGIISLVVLGVIGWYSMSQRGSSGASTEPMLADTVSQRAVRSDSSERAAIVATGTRDSVIPAASAIGSGSALANAGAVSPAAPATIQSSSPESADSSSLASAGGNKSQRSSDQSALTTQTDGAPTTANVAAGKPAQPAKLTAVTNVSNESGRIIPARFDLGSAEVRNIDDAIVSGIIAHLNGDPASTVKVVGHTSSDGNDDLNVILSRQRADAFKRVLVGKGARESRISVEGVGSREPIASNETVAGRRRNRRVEVRY